MIVRIQNEEKFLKNFFKDIKKLNSRLENPVVPDDLGLEETSFLVKGPEGFPVSITREYRKLFVAFSSTSSMTSGSNPLSFAASSMSFLS